MCRRHPRCHSAARRKSLDGSTALPLPPSPAWTLADAQTALWDACGRYRAATGHDGLKLAHDILERDHGHAAASLVLAPLRPPLGGSAASPE